MKSNATYSPLIAAMGLLICLSTQPALGFVTAIVQPSSQVAFVGSNVVFSAQVTATAGEIVTGYTWLTSPNGQNPFTTIPGATTATCTLVNVQTNDTGYYFVRVTYNSGTTIGLTSVSSAVTLTVADQARITAQPQGGLIRSVGTSASFSVSAMGFPPPGYQWRLNGTNLVDNGRVTGSTDTLLTIGALVTADTGSYDVVVTNAYSSVTSQVATLGVYVPLSFSAPPQDTAVVVGSNAVLSVTVDGSQPIGYQWQKGGANLVDGGRISGATSNVLTIAATTTNDTGNYSVSVTNPVTATSAVARLTVLVPARFTSGTSAAGKQGVSFSFANTATGTTPIIYSASGLPDGLNLDPVTGVISGAPVVNGIFAATIGASNVCSYVTQALTLTITSSVPVITSATTAKGTEDASGFTYNIRATDSPILYGASGLPLGLTVNTNTGAITGTPLLGGTFNAQIWAINAWGLGSTNLTFSIAYATIGGLAIANVTHVYSKPYLLDFAFELRDGPDPSTSSPVVVPPSQLQVTCMEDAVPITSESPIILQSASLKQLKSFLVLDYTYSMLAAGAIDAMQSSAELLINEEPANALFGIYEFHAEYVNPQVVTTNPAAKSAFLSDKPTLSTVIDGIQTNYVQGNYAGTRCWDAMYAALKNYGVNNGAEQRYLIAMTDGNDTSSQLNTNVNPGPVTNIITLALAQQVKIYCVAFGSDVNTNALQQLTSQTGGHYYLAATTDDLPIEFQKIVKDISGQYLLRWATLNRSSKPFQPSFEIGLQGYLDTYNTNLIYYTNIVIDTNPTPPVTNYIQGTNIPVLPYKPSDYSNDVKVGFLRLVPDANAGPQITRLRADYVPRFIRQMRLNYRPNYPCTSSLAISGTNSLLYGWSLTETAATNGLRTLTVTSPDPTDLLTSIPYADFGDLVSFNFTYPDALTAQQAFSFFGMDNSIYTNMQPSGQSFVLSNASGFVTTYAPPPPHGTPIPWLIYYGYTSNYAGAEVLIANGLPVWQAYLAGLDLKNTNSLFNVSLALPPGQAPQITFSTAATRAYRLESATMLGDWVLLLDNIPGTGGNILFIDNRVLTSLNPVYYRVGVHALGP